MSNREDLRLTFNQVAELYDAARPGYPEALWNDLFGNLGLRAGDAVLEVGCGTGQASVSLAERGVRLTAVELGGRLAEIARRRLSGYDAEVLVDDFDHAPLPDQAFDAVFAATSWHWLDPKTRYARAAQTLREGGRLAIVKTDHAFPEDFDPFFEEIQIVYGAIGDSDFWPPPKPEAVRTLAPEIEASNLFRDIAIRRYLWIAEYTADEYVALLQTYSDHYTFTPEQRNLLYGEVHRRLATRKVRKHYLSTLHVATKA